MQKIPAKDRFNQNLKSVSTPVDLLHEALRQFGMNPQTCQLKQLSGGFMNANFLAEERDQKVVLRVYASDADTAKKEFDLLRFLESSPIPAPSVHANFEVQGRPIVVMEYLEGITMEDRILSGASFELGIYEDLGRELGEIHKTKFDRAGFIGPQMKIITEFDNFSAFIGRFIVKTLKDLEERPDKLDLATNRRFQSLVKDKWHLVTQTEQFPQLVHCDFNPKNILVSKHAQPKILGVIDWEFALAGNGIIDIGNFFRFAYDYPEGARDRFIHGYRAVNPNLPPDWEACAKLIDLGNMCGFLERKENYQKSFRTARAVINATLEHFGY